MNQPSPEPVSEKTYQPIKRKIGIDSYPMGPEQFALADKLINRISYLKCEDSRRTAIAEFFGILASKTQLTAKEALIEHDKATSSHARKEALREVLLRLENYGDVESCWSAAKDFITSELAKGTE